MCGDKNQKLSFPCALTFRILEIYWRITVELVFSQQKSRRFGGIYVLHVAVE
jgi:hypothetical protein